MKLLRVRFTVRRLMAVVAVVALVSLVVSNPDRHNGITDKRVVIPVASLVAAGYGLGAIRHPLAFLVPLIVVWIATPQVDHPTPDLINTSAGGCLLGWIIGAPVGRISRGFRSIPDPSIIYTDPPEPSLKTSPTVPFASRKLKILGVIVIGIPLALMLAWNLLLRSFWYNIAAHKYNEYADYYEKNTPVWEGCYGGRWDDYSEAISRDIDRHKEDRVYRESKSKHFRNLARTYENASRYPWLTLDPAPPEHDPE